MKGRLKKSIAFLMVLAMIFNVGFTAYAEAGTSNLIKTQEVDTRGGGEQLTVTEAVYEDPVVYISYTVQFLDQDGNKLLDDKVVTGQTIEATVTEYAENIDGYTVDEDVKELTLAATDNVITFIYTPVTVMPSMLMARAAVTPTATTPNYDADVRYVFGQDFNIIPKSKNEHTNVAVLWKDNSGYLYLAVSLLNTKYPDIVKYNNISSQLISDTSSNALIITVQGKDPTEFNANEYKNSGADNHRWIVAKSGQETLVGTFNIIVDPKNATGHDINQEFQMVNTVSYTVKYLEQGTDKELEVPNVVENQVAGETVIEIAKEIPDYTPNENSKSLTLVKEESKNVITFYYTAISEPKINVTGKKVWVDGPAVKPAVYLKLYRNDTVISSEVTLVNGTTEYTWNDLDKTDSNGVDYVYSIKETGKPANYSKSEDGLTITNTYVIPKADLTATKTWVGGPTSRPTIQLQLYRQIGTQGQREKVGDPVALADGVTGYTWKGQDITDINGQTYTFNVDEVGVPENYTRKIAGLNITNTYVSPKIDVSGTKVWVGGPETKPTIQLQLLKNGEAFGAPTELASGTTTATWTGLDKTDNTGADYIYIVDEVEVPTNYTKSLSDLTVTNTYASPKIDVTGTKVWVGGPEAKPTIKLQLLRNGVTFGAEEKELVNGTTTATWTGLDKTDNTGADYIYIVDEVEVPTNYTKSLNGLTVTNTYDKTPYKVEHYLQNADFATYSLKEEEHKTGTTGAKVDAYDNYYPGYYLNLSVEGTIASGIIAADGSLVLKLYYKAIPYGVIYDPNGGTGEMRDPNNPYIYGEEVTVLANSFINPVGYHFTHWMAQGEEYGPYMARQVLEVPEFQGGVYYHGDKFKMPQYDITLIAQWALNEYTITYQAGPNGSLAGGTRIDKILHGDSYSAAPTPVANAGYYFSGWTPALPGASDKVIGDKTFTANFARTERPEKPEKPEKPDKPIEVVIIDEPIPAAVPELNKEDHFQYIQGYPDNTVKPEGHITRDEVAAVFYRLLAKEYRDSIKTDVHKFSDVAANRWSNKHITTLAKGGIVTGYTDGTYRPGNYITRAELSTIASRFDNLSPFTSDKFSDIAGHWANKYINSAAEKGWVKGYSDGTFKPDQYITRAEFVTLVNNVLGRRVTIGEILPEAKQFPDLSKTKWYYEAMQEAINSHYYFRLDDTYEDWTEIYYPSLEM